MKTTHIEPPNFKEERTSHADPCDRGSIAQFPIEADKATVTYSDQNIRPCLVTLEGVSMNQFLEQTKNLFQQGPFDLGDIMDFVCDVLRDHPQEVNTLLHRLDGMVEEEAENMDRQQIKQYGESLETSKTPDWPYKPSLKDVREVIEKSSLASVFSEDPDVANKAGSK